MASRADRPAPHPLVSTSGLIAGLGIILFLLLMVFILPSLKCGPHHLAVGVSGSAAPQLERALGVAAPDAYDPQTFESEQALRTAITERAVVGGFVSDGQGIHVLVASAGSSAVSGSLTATAQALGKASNVPVSVEDIVPLPAGDPTGIGIGGLAFPLVFGGIVPAVAFHKIHPRSTGWRLAGIVAFAAVGGTIVAAVLRFVFGSIDTNFWPVAAATALGICALAVPLAGLQEVFGTKGFTIGAMTMMFLGNPLAGIAVSSVWLPSALGTLGQLLPPGAAGTLVRAAAYFDGAGGGRAALTLAVWVVIGLALHVVGAMRAIPEPEEDVSPVGEPVPVG